MTTLQIGWRQWWHIQAIVVPLILATRTYLAAHQHSQGTFLCLHRLAACQVLNGLEKIEIFYIYGVHRSESRTHLCQRCLGTFDGHIAGIGDEGGDQYILAGHITTAIQNDATLDLSAAHTGDHAQLVLHLTGKGLL